MTGGAALTKPRPAQLTCLHSGAQPEPTNGSRRARPSISKSGGAFYRSGTPFARANWRTGKRRPEGALARVIVLDQFPRNMFRDDRRTYATDELARGVAERAIGRGFDRQVSHPERQFFYLTLAIGRGQLTLWAIGIISDIHNPFSCRMCRTKYRVFSAVPA
jgi:hypothetical protein